jgi:hypothetical protein
MELLIALYLWIIGILFGPLAVALKLMLNSPGTFVFAISITFLTCFLLCDRLFSGTQLIFRFFAAGVFYAVLFWSLFFVVGLYIGLHNGDLFGFMRISIPH